MPPGTHRNQSAAQSECCLGPLGMCSLPSHRQLDPHPLLGVHVLLPRNPLYCPNVAISPFLAPRDTCFAHSEKIQAQSTRDKCGQSSRFRLSTLPDSRPLPRGPTLLHDPECIASLCSSVLEEGSSLNGGGLQSQGQDLPRALSKGSHYHCSRNK